MAVYTVHLIPSVDRLFVSALIELRPCERFAVLAADSDDAELAAFYRALFTSPEEEE